MLAYDVFGTHLSSKVLRLFAFLVFAAFLPNGKAFQKRRVSSPAPVTIVCPDGFIAKNSTLLVCPVKVLTFYKLGYFHMIISLFEYPWVDTIYLVVFENIRLHTWEPVSILSRRVPFRVFQNLIVRSAEPPPEAKTPWLWGLQARALTAAQWWLNLLIGVFEEFDHIISLLSLPPEARWFPSNDHFNPQTSCVWPSYLLTICRSDSLRSLITIVLSLDPLASKFPLHARELTLS